MTYLQEFQAQIAARNFPKFLQLWEEYCTNDQVDFQEFKELLLSIKNSEMAKSFGKLVETALPLWKTAGNKKDAYELLALLIDLETSNSPILAEIALDALKEKYGNDPHFNERIRIVGLRTRDQFQGALSHYDLLAHMEKGNYVLHSSGWGAGEIMDVSLLRQQLTIEFENVRGNKQLTFTNAFKTLSPLPNGHFFMRRFADPDQLEEEARNNPVEIIKGLLRDLGPKTASEIKDLMSEYVIPEQEWSKWWQNTRTKLKKDPFIESPETVRDPFRLRESEITHEERFERAITHKTNIDEIIQSAYALLRDLPHLQKHPEVKDALKKKLLEQLSNPDLRPDQELQIGICLETQFGHQLERNTKELVQRLDNIEEVINEIEIIALKKRTLALIKECRKDWAPLFLKFFLTIKHSALRDYLLKELNQGETKKELEKAIDQLMLHPERHPDCFLWYFQQLLEPDCDKIPLASKEGQCQCFEAFFVLMHRIENLSHFKDFVKKMYNFLTAKRYEIVRQVMESAPRHHVEEFLLLASKCHTLTDHDKQILRSLAAVVHPELGKGKEAEKIDAHGILWTTEESLLKVQERIRHIGDIEVIDNAREIEAARALGDLRENSEYKFALERRSRLQGQLKSLSEQLKHARIITKKDISHDEVGVGNVVEISDEKGKKITYTILGPWEADPDKNILSFQSQLAQAMMGCKKGDSFQFRNDQFKVTSLKSYL